MSEKQILKISQSLSEPKEFFAWRKELVQWADPSTKLGAGNKKNEKPYSLGIRLDPAVFEQKKKETDILPLCEIRHDGNVRVFEWSQGLQDVPLKKIILETLQDATVSLKKNIHAAQNAGMFESGKIIVCSAGSKENVFVKTTFVGDAKNILFVVAEEGSKVSFFDDTENSVQTISGKTVVLVAKENASITYVQSKSGAGTLYSNTVSFAHKNANITFLDIVATKDGVIKSDVEHFLKGANAKVNTHSTSVSNGTGVVDLYNATVHGASNTKSFLSAAGVAGGQSKTIYRSNISMKASDIKNIEGEQKARFLMVSENAEIDAIPSLDIAQKDVVCSHSVSISHLKDNDLYYPRLRGINIEEASNMMVEGMLFAELSNIFGKNEDKEVQKEIARIWEKVKNAVS
jgi:Fe-S cluster assembly scaffold protein SufB